MAHLHGNSKIHRNSKLAAKILKLTGHWATEKTYMSQHRPHGNRTTHSRENNYCPVPIINRFDVKRWRSEIHHNSTADANFFFKFARFRVPEKTYKMQQTTWKSDNPFSSKELLTAARYGVD